VFWQWRFECLESRADDSDRLAEAKGISWMVAVTLYRVWAKVVDSSRNVFAPATKRTLILTSVGILAEHTHIMLFGYPSI